MGIADCELRIVTHKDVKLTENTFHEVFFVSSVPQTFDFFAPREDFSHAALISLLVSAARAASNAVIAILPAGLS